MPKSKIETLVVILIVISLTINDCDGSKILMTGAQIKSHILEQLAIGEELVARGHQVYLGVGSRYEAKKAEAMGIKVLTYHIPPDVFYFGGDDINEYTKSIIFESKDADDMLYRQLTIASPILHRDCAYMMADREFIEAVRSVQFDMAIVEPFLLGPCNMILPKYLGIRFVTLSAGYAPWDIRIPALPSFYNFGMKGRSNRLMSFGERFKSLAMFLLHQFDFLLKPDHSLLEQYRNTSSSPLPSSWRELLLEAELFIAEMDHLLDTALPAMPNLVTLPGLTSRPAKPLSADLEQLVSSSKHGVILVTFGASSGDFPDAIVKKFLDAFAQLNQTVLAKLPIPEGLTPSANVNIRSWLPQNDLLGHNNTKLFITHCGNNGQYEALYHGVPMIGFPLYAEQDKNSHRGVQKGFGLHMNIHDFTADDLVRNIREVLWNPSYTKEIKLASTILHDEPMNAREKAAFWIEHVIKHGGKHLRSEAMDMPFYQFVLVDILALAYLVLLLITITILIGGGFVIKHLLRKTVSTNQGSSTKGNSKVKNQ